MTLKKAKAVISVALCACLLSGCGNSGTSEPSSSLPSLSESSASAASGVEQDTEDVPASTAPSAISAPSVDADESGNDLNPPASSTSDGTAGAVTESSSETASDETGENAVSDGLAAYTSIYDIPFVELDYDGSRNCLSLNGEPWIAAPGNSQFGDICFSDGKILIIQCFFSEKMTGFAWLPAGFDLNDKISAFPEETYNKLFTYAEGYTLYTDDGYQYTVERP